MFDNYICAFKKSTLYRLYLQGGPFGHGPNGNELLLRRLPDGQVILLDLLQAMANYTFGLSFINHLPHLKGEEVFGSYKRPVNCPLGANNDSHRPDHVNFFRP
jgi:hypothetical protein